MRHLHLLYFCLRRKSMTFYPQDSSFCRRKMTGYGPMDGLTERPTDRLMDRPTDRWMNRQTHAIEIRSCIQKRSNQAQITKIGISMYFLIRATRGHTDGHMDGQINCRKARHEHIHMHGYMSEHNRLQRCKERCKQQVSNW